MFSLPRVIGWKFLGCIVCTIRCVLLAVSWVIRSLFIILLTQSDRLKCLGCNVCTIRYVLLAVLWVIRSLFIVLFPQSDRVEGLRCNVCTIRFVVLAVAWVIRSLFIVLFTQSDRVEVFRVYCLYYSLCSLGCVVGNKVIIHCSLYPEGSGGGFRSNVCIIRCVVLAASWVIRSLLIVLFTQRDRVEGLGCNV